jgi:hypothetical protein
MAALVCDYCACPRRVDPGCPVQSMACAQGCPSSSNPAPAIDAPRANTNINGKCYSTDLMTSLQAAGDMLTMGGSMVSGFITCIFFCIFLYFATRMKKAFPIILTGCCFGSFVTSILQYVWAKKDLDELQSTKMTAVPCSSTDSLPTA